jgi:hypothetical protein
MKRLVLIAGIALSIISCAQHDTKSPDTSGNNPGAPNQTTTGDTSLNNGGNNMNTNGTTNSRDTGTMNNQQNQ